MILDVESQDSMEHMVRTLVVYRNGDRHEAEELVYQLRAYRDVDAARVKELTLYLVVTVMPL